MSTLRGKVKWFNGKKGYGFIERDDKEKDVFVHASAVRDANLKYLNEGDVLTFEVEQGDKGTRQAKSACLVPPSPSPVGACQQQGYVIPGLPKANLGLPGFHQGFYQGFTRFITRLLPGFPRFICWGSNEFRKLSLMLRHGSSTFGLVL